MTNQPVLTPARRILRTILQALVALVPGVPVLAALFDLPAEDAAEIAAAFGVLVVVVTAVQNSLEGSGTVPTAFATRDTTVGVAEVGRDEAGHADGALLGVAACIVIAVVALLVATGVL